MARLFDSWNSIESYGFLHMGFDPTGDHIMEHHSVIEALHPQTVVAGPRCPCT
jgi:hypothetical protein